MFLSAEQAAACMYPQSSLLEGARAADGPDPTLALQCVVHRMPQQAPARHVLDAFMWCAITPAGVRCLQVLPVVWGIAQQAPERYILYLFM